MDWSYIHERNRLAHIVMLLLSFALRAETVASKSRGERRYLIDLIRQAEGSGLRLILAYGYWDGDPTDTGYGYSSREAIRLADSLRTLASILSFHVGLFDQFSAAQRAWIEDFTLGAVIWLATSIEPGADTAKVPLIDTS